MHGWYLTEIACAANSLPTRPPRHCADRSPLLLGYPIYLLHISRPFCPIPRYAFSVSVSVPICLIIAVRFVYRYPPSFRRCGEASNDSFCIVSEVVLPISLSGCCPCPFANPAGCSSHSDHACTKLVQVAGSCRPSGPLSTIAQDRADDRRHFLLP